MEKQYENENKNVRKIYIESVSEDGIHKSYAVIEKTITRSLSSILNMFPELEEDEDDGLSFWNRIVQNTQTFSDYEWGPRLVMPIFFCFDLRKEQIIHTTDYIEREVTSEELNNFPELACAIDDKIQQMHLADWIHGDLHRGNIRWRFRNNNNNDTNTDANANEQKQQQKQKQKIEVYFLDVDTAFTRYQWDNHKFPKRWMTTAFDWDEDELVSFSFETCQQRERENWRI
jgi:tRNA A-37 threonylcarbamoyl transferase component Bud32